MERAPATCSSGPTSRFQWSVLRTLFSTALGGPSQQPMMRLHSIYGEARWEQALASLKHIFSFTIEIRTRACSFRLCAGSTGRRRAGGGAKNQEPRCEGGASRNGTAPCACRIWTKPERSCDAKEELPGAARLWRARAGRDLSGASNDACNYDELLIDSAP